MKKAKVYFTQGATWLIGPLHEHNVDDEVEIRPYRRWFGDEHPGCPKARVTRVDTDGVAHATDIEVLDE